MESRDTIGSLPNLRNDVDQNRKERDRAMEMKKMAQSSSCLSTTTKGSGSDTASRASTLPREKRRSWSYCFQMQYVDSVIAAAKAGDHVKMTELVGKLGTEGFAAIIREHDGKNNGPLHYAALNKDVLMTKLLLQYGADVNDVGDGGKSPLHFAALLRANDKVTPMQDSEPSEGTLYPTQSQYSIDEKSDSSSSDESPFRPHKALLGFLKGKEKKKPAKSMISLNVKKSEGEQSQPVTASTKSLTSPQAEEEKAHDHGHGEAMDEKEEREDRRGDENIVDILLSAGADASAKDTKGTTPLHLALMHANVDAFKHLLTAPGVDIDAQDRRGATPLFKACKSGNTEGALTLINKEADILIADVNGDTPLHVAVRHSHSMIVMALIEAAQSKGQINKLLMDENSRGVIPLYDAVRCGHRDLFQVCLSHVSKRMTPGWEVDMDKLINFSSRDNDDSLLHVAAAAGYLDIVESLIIHGAMVNRVNFDGQTPLHLACEKNHESIALSLVENGGDVNIEDSACLNPLQVAVNNQSFETLMTLLQYISASSGGHSDEATDILQWSAANNKANTLRRILDYDFRFHEMTDDGIMDFIVDAVKNKHLETVHVLVRWNRAVVDHLDKFGNTPLHHAAEGGHEDIAQELIQAKAQVNAKNGVDLGGLSPLHYIAARGWTRTARVLLDSYADINQPDNLKMTPLHHACKHGKLGMVDLLLYRKGAGTVTKPADVTLRDSEGRNCLDHAIDNGHEAIATMIITHDRWQEVMSVSSRDEETNYLTTPMRKLIRTMPGVAKLVLDRCITVTGGTSIRDKDVRVEFYYELLEDAFSPWMKPTGDAPPKNDGAINALLNRMYRRVSTQLPSDIDDQYDKRDHLVKSAEPFITNSQERNDYHPLQMMVDSKHVDLLDHPLVTTFVRNKWNTVGRYTFYTGFFVYLIFLAMLTGYIIVIPPNYYVRAVNHNHSDKIVWFADGERRWVKSVPDSLLIMFDVFGPTAIMILSLLNIFREFGQMFVQRLSYFRDGGNIMELFLYTAAILFSLPFSHVEYVKHGDIKKHWQWPIGATAGFLGWINLLLFIRSNSKLGIYVIMFIDIFKTFLKFSLILFLFVMAFGLAFYALLMNQNPFHSLFDSLAKTFVMMIGELDYADIFFAQDYLGTSNTLESDGEEAYFMNSAFYLNITQLFFILFLIVMSILMMNMLVGLAVDDIQAIQEKANLHRLTMQANTAMQNQSKFPLWMWRRSVVRRKTFFLNEVRLKKWLRRLTGGRKQLKRALQIGNETENPLTIDSSNEEVYYEKVRERLKELSWKVERATVEMMEDTKKREAQLDHIRGGQSSLFDRTNHLQATQERLADRVEVMHRKMDVMIKKLKIKQKKVEGLF